jgi:ribosomal protein S18 acetylase RimI-like enzyme
VAIVEPLDWDTRVLGIPAGRLELVASAAMSSATLARLLDAAVAAAPALGIRHLSARVDAADDAAIHALEARGFLNVDALLTFAAGPADLSGAVTPAGIRTIRTASADDSNAVAELAETAFRHGRFHSDPSIAPERAAAVYHTWAAACCAGTAADVVLVAEAGDRLAGFVACRMQDDTAVHLDRATGTIPLIATSDRFQGQGVGATLVTAAGAWFAGRNASAVEIGTQLRNVPAARLYERCGFRLVGGSLSFRVMVTP